MTDTPSVQPEPPEVPEGRGTPPSRVGRNTFINVVGALAPIGISLLTIPPYLHLIGQARYGVLAVIWVVFGYFGIFEFGLSRATANQIAKMRDEPPELREKLFWTAVVLNTAIGILGGVALFLCGRLILIHVLDVSTTLRSEAMSGLPWLALAVPASTLALVLTGTLEGLERWLAVNVLALGTLASSQLAPLAYAYWIRPDLGGLVMSASIALIASTGLFFIVTLFFLPVTGRPQVDRRLVNGLFRYGGWITVSNILTPLLSVGDRLFIGAVLGARAVTRYTIPFLLVGRTLVLPNSLVRTLFPRFSMLPEKQAAAMAREALRAVVATMTPIAVLGTVLVEPFLRVWVGASISRSGAAVAEILLVGAWLQSVASVPYIFLQAQGRPDITAKFHLLELPPYVGALALGVHALGIAGAAWAWTGRLAMDAALLLTATRRAFAVEGMQGTYGLLLSAGSLVLASCICSLTVFGSPWIRGLLGGILVSLSLALAWGIAPPQLRKLVSFLPRLST